MPPTARDGATLNRHGLARRAELLHALSDAMLATPWKRLSVRDVAAGAHVGPGAFWRYFADLESAIVALAEDQAPDVPRHVMRVLKLIAAEGYPGARHALAATAQTTKGRDQ